MLINFPGDEKIDDRADRGVGRQGDDCQGFAFGHVPGVEVDAEGDGFAGLGGRDVAVGPAAGVAVDLVDAEAGFALVPEGVGRVDFITLPCLAEVEGAAFEPWHGPLLLLLIGEAGEIFFGEGPDVDCLVAVIACSRLAVDYGRGFICLFSPYLAVGGDCVCQFGRAACRDGILAEAEGQLRVCVLEAQVQRLA